MTRIKIENLPKDMKISKEEMKSIMGGKISTFRLVVGTVWSWIAGPPREDTPDNAVVGVRG